MAFNENPEEFAWPAFVDALTTMTMILTFVMLILAVAVGSLSQNASRMFVETFNEIARQKGLKPITPAMPHGEVIAAIKSLENPEKTPEASSQPAQNSEPPKPLPIVQEEKQITLAALPDQQKGTKAVEALRSHAILRLNYPARQTRLDPSAEKDLKDFINGSEQVAHAKMLEVRVSAPSSAGSLTEARRVAYYRAMLIRMRLLDQGISPEKIVLKVDDQFNQAEGDSLKIFAQPAAPVN